MHSRMRRSVLEKYWEAPLKNRTKSAPRKLSETFVFQILQKKHRPACGTKGSAGWDVVLSGNYSFDELTITNTDQYAL